MSPTYEVRQLDSSLLIDSIFIARQVMGGEKAVERYGVKRIIRARPRLLLPSLRQLGNVLCDVPVLFWRSIHQAAAGIAKR